MGRSLSVTVGTVPDAPASGTVVDGMDAADAATAVVMGVRTVAESVPVGDSVTATIGVDRESLVYGTYEPTTTTAGLLTPEAALAAYNSASAQDVTIPDGALIEDQIIYGRVVFAGSAELRNCLLVGRSTALTSGNDAVINAVAARTGIARLYDCEIRPRQESPGRNCVLGGKIELYRCWLHQGEDGIGIYPANGAGTVAAVKVMGCLIEDLGYAFPDRDHGDGSHSDLIQIQGGTGIEIAGNSLRGSGHWMPTSGTYYTANPSSTQGDWSLTKSPPATPGSCIIIQNNVGAPFDSTVKIEDNYFRSGKAQLLVKSTANNFVCRNNRFSAENPPASNVNGTVHNGVALTFTYNPYWIRFDSVAASGSIDGLTSGGALANITNCWLDGGRAGSALVTPRASGVSDG